MKVDVRGSGLGFPRGRKAIHMEMEKQMFVEPGRSKGAEWTLMLGSSRVSPATPSPCSLQIYLMIALFQEQALNLYYFR